MTADEMRKHHFQSFLDEYQKLLAKYGLSSQPVITFPRRQSIPALSKMAVKLIGKQGGILDVRFDFLNK